MDNQAMSDLISQIKTEPSVLFLGQGYLRSLSGQDCFYDTVNRTLCEGKAPATPAYQILWEHVNAGQPIQPEQFNQMYRVVCDLPTQNWLRSILSMRWGMVFTSAVDSCLTHCVGPNFTFNALGYDKSHFKREYMSKSSLHGVYLYGSVDGSNGETPPAVCDPKTMRSLKKRVNDRIGWIYNEILRDYGVLVIDGWDPRRDWLSFLLDNASDMPYHSIFLFSAASEILEDETIQGLVEDEILTYYPQTFAQALEEYGYFQEETVSWDTDYAAGEGGKTVTIRSKSGQDIPLLIPFSSLDVLDTRITLLDDDLGFENQRRSTESRSEAFARYLQQNSTPIWPLCTLQAGFHFERGIDDELWSTADTLLRQKASYRRSLLVLEGVSNSGKTAALVHFAMRIREEHRYPVFYISGNPTQTTFSENLKNFIKRYLQGRQDGDGAWVERVIILWDGNLGSDAVRQYAHLSRELAECNALVIGTIYRHDSGAKIVGSPSKGSITYVPVQATLTQNEKKALSKLLQGIDPTLNDRFQAAVKRAKEPNLIYLLQHIARCQYSPEWKAVSNILKERFEAEVDRSESNVQHAMEDFQRGPTEEEVHDEIVKRGVGAAWQMTLARKLEEMQKDDPHSEEPPQHGDAAEVAGKDSSKALLKDIRLLNEALAMAGQFSVSMPVTLLLNMIHHDGNILSKENMFLNKLLVNDSLVDYSRDEEGYPFVRFRHPKEAELYVEKNFGGDPDSRRKLEVDLLCRLITACHWNEDEAYDVIALIRCFGPNSAGKYSQDIPRGNYGDYISFLPQIADCLMEYADGNPEAMLVFAHFLRETYSANQKSGQPQPDSRDYLCEAKNKLRIAIERHDQQNLQQYNRLLVEVCSNLVASMPRSHTASFDRDVFREFQNMFKLAVKTWDPHHAVAFGTNSLLDIWLNAVTNFHHSFRSDEEAMKDPEFLEALARSLDYIDRLFEINTDFTSSNLLEKVERVYQLDPKRSVDEIVRRLEIQGNDTFLYLNARRCWLSESDAPLRQEAGEKDIVLSNLFLLPDNADAHADLIEFLPELRKKAAGAAKKAVKLLEDNMGMIQRSRSSRCLHMLIRAKWLLYTGRMPLEEKQQPALSKRQWEEISDLCRSYNTYRTNDDLHAQNLESLLQAVYLWSFTPDVGQATSIFSQLRQQMGSSWYVERIGLCVPEQQTLRTFYVDVERNASGNYVARIAREVTRISDKVTDLRGRYNIHISSTVQHYLFDGQAPHNQYCIRKPVTLWFTANGPSLGIGKEAR